MLKQKQTQIQLLIESKQKISLNIIVFQQQI